MSDDAKQKLREVLEDVLSDDRTSLTDFEAVVNALWDKRIRTKGALRDVSEQELKDCGLDALASVIQHRLRGHVNGRRRLHLCTLPAPVPDGTCPAPA